MIKFPTLLKLADSPYSRPNAEACLIAAGHKRYALTSEEATLLERILAQDEIDELLDQVAFGRISPPLN